MLDQIHEHWKLENAWKWSFWMKETFVVSCYVVSHPYCNQLVQSSNCFKLFFWQWLHSNLRWQATSWKQKTINPSLKHFKGSFYSSESMFLSVENHVLCLLFAMAINSTKDVIINRSVIRSVICHFYWHFFTWNKFIFTLFWSRFVTAKIQF